MLRVEGSCPQSTSDVGLVSPDLGLDERPLAIAGRSPSFHRLCGRDQIQVELTLSTAGFMQRA